MTIYILILHFGKSKTTNSCLWSVLRMDKDHWDVKTIVIDNDPIQRFQPNKRSIKVIRNDKNLGFAAGMNIGIKKALRNKSTDYILLLNNDTILPKDLLKVLLKEKSDIIAPVIKFKSRDKKWIYDYGGKVNWWTGRTSHYESSKYPTDQFENLEVDYVSGCCMLVKRTVFDEIGLLDEDYFFYFEDVDLCTRAQRQGFDVAVATDTTTHHKLSGAIGRWSSEAIRYNLISNFTFINKYFGFRKLTAFPYMLLLSVKIIFNRLWGR